MRNAAALALVALLLAPGAAGWTQLRGSAGRDSLATLVEEPLDLLWTRELLPPDEDLSALLGPNWVETPRGLVAVSRQNETGACTLVAIDDLDAGTTRRVPLEGCVWGWLQGYVASLDAVLVCSLGVFDHPHLQARALDDGALLWKVAAADLGVVDPDPASFWGCSGVAIDEEAGEIVAPFLNSRTGLDWVRHRIAALDVATGRPRWVQQIAWVGAAQLALVTVPATAGGIADGGASDFIPVAVTLTGSGMVVTGLVLTADPNNLDPDFAEYGRLIQVAVAWLTRDGTLRGVESAHLAADAAREGAVTSQRAGTGSLWAASRGRLALSAVGDSVLLINPEAPAPVARGSLTTPERPVNFDLGWTAPAWGHQLIVVPTTGAIVVFDEADLSHRWAWTAAPGFSLDDVLVTEGGSIYALSSERNSTASTGPSQGNRTILTRLDAAGEPVLEIDLLAEVYFATEPAVQRLAAVRPTGASGSEAPAWLRRPTLVPISDGRLAVSDITGRLSLLGPASEDRKPMLRFHDAWPSPGEPARLVIEPPPGAPPIAATVRWGDGSIDRVAPDDAGRIAVEHAFGARSAYDVTATIVYSDGTTATRIATVDVGGARPPDLNFMQRAFAPENENRTWGVVGLAIAALGILAALVQRRRRRGILQDELRELDEIRRHGDPVLAVRALADYRSRLQRSLRSGRIDDAQFGMLQDRASRIARRIHDHAVAPFSHQFDAPFRQRLADALEDGYLTPDEQAALLRALDDQRDLAPADRRRVRDLLSVGAHEP